MGMYFSYPLVLFAVFIVPLLVGFAASLRWGPRLGPWIGIVPTLVVSLVLFFLQVSSGPDISRATIAWRYFASESVFFLASYLVGAAIGSVLHRLRHPRVP
ncbi:hypothetical protein [Pseudoroseicyclus sp. CXY001]|uniref:hypothetical protein n=1 Tax=Pseudoroseicyclus sp. CXY001 TaxID=3242492 RepID=UPI0035715148